MALMKFSRISSRKRFFIPLSLALKWVLVFQEKKNELTKKYTLGQTPLFGNRRGFMSPQLKTKNVQQCNGKKALSRCPELLV